MFYVRLSRSIFNTGVSRATGATGSKRTVFLPELVWCLLISELWKLESHK